jgi:hypothetical protein
LPVWAGYTGKPYIQEIRAAMRGYTVKLIEEEDIPKVKNLLMHAMIFLL